MKPCDSLTQKLQSGELTMKTKPTEAAIAENTFAAKRLRKHKRENVMSSFCASLRLDLPLKKLSFAALALIACLAQAGLASAAQVTLNVELAKPVLKADTKQTTFLKVGLTGFAIANDKERPPVNVALVLDKSGSMQGEKIRQAREAAKMAIGRLGANDIVSVVVYDSTVNVLVPATKCTDKAAIYAKIDQIGAGGNTALFGGVSKGAAELRKFFDKQRVNRIFLLSDGKANNGPSSPGELGQLGASLIKEGISVTTLGLGLGYNEDLMTQLALKSDGSHSFIQEPSQLTQIFNEDFGEMLDVVAQKVVVSIDCKAGVRPVRVLGREADISGQTVVTTMNQLYSKQEQFVLLEVEVPSTRVDQVRDIATVHLSYLNMGTKVNDHLSSSVAARFSKSETEIAKRVCKDVMVSCVSQIAVENNKKATELRDKGRVEEAKALLVSNGAYLEKNARMYNSDFLKNYGYLNSVSARNLDAANWGRNRKQMRYEQQAVQQGKVQLRANGEWAADYNAQLWFGNQGTNQPPVKKGNVDLIIKIK
jgi:Ca-activated chloride channel family protein